MEDNRQVGSSSASSFTNELFGSKDSPNSAASNGIFSSIFPPQSMVAAKSCLTTELCGYFHKKSSGSQSLNASIPGHVVMNKEAASNSLSNKEKSAPCHEISEPSPLSSSLYYGGQEDMYINSYSSHMPGSYPYYKKDGGAEDPSGSNSHGASRGNWWKGSLYY